MSQEPISRGPDFLGAVSLLESMNLPVADLTPAHCRDFFFLGSAQTPRAVIGLESLGEVALLRSLAVEPALQRTGAGSRLVSHAEQYARTQGIREIYLLTTTAEKFFAKRGYRSLSRDSAPAAIRDTREFAGICPASSALMAKSLWSVTIYHNPGCGTSRNTLGLIRNAGIEPVVVEYLQQPPDRARLVSMINAAGLSVRAALREKGTPYAQLGLADPGLTDDQLLDAMLRHPILINRPFVVTSIGTRLCRPSELVLDILPAHQRGFFAKEDGEVVIDERGERVR